MCRVSCHIFVLFLPLGSNGDVGDSVFCLWASNGDVGNLDVALDRNQVCYCVVMTSVNHCLRHINELMLSSPNTIHSPRPNAFSPWATSIAIEKGVLSTFYFISFWISDKSFRITLLIFVHGSMDSKLTVTLSGIQFQHKTHQSWRITYITQTIKFNNIRGLNLFLNTDTFNLSSMTLNSLFLRMVLNHES